MPVAGVDLYCDSCGSPEGHTFTTSDTNGFYSFEWVNNGVHPLIVWKDGYQVVDPEGMLADGRQMKYATVAGDTQFEIHVVRR